MNVTKILDCAGLFCPMPIANTRRELEKMHPGEVLEIIADDPGFEKDLPAWCEATGEQLLEMKKEDGVLKGYVRKK
jgi:TusA-related sulfurtransferase